MNHQTVARVLLSVLCALQGLGSLAVDLNRSHATNPRWVGHARFHVVWQTISLFSLAAIEVGLIWWHGSGEEQRFYLAAGLASVPVIGFLGALVFRRWYRGELYDSNGILPLRISIGARTIQVDLNLAIEVFALLMLGALIAVYRL